MAISINAIWEVRTTGNDTNGGGFVAASSGVDWSQQDAAQYSVADGATAGTTTITSATANFGTDVVGNIIYVQGGTGGVVAGWYEIMSRTNATTIVVDRSTGLTAGTGVTLRIGGAFATPGRLNIANLAGQRAYVRTGTYVLTTTVVGPAGPVYSVAHVLGYGTARNDGARFTVDCGALANFQAVRTNGAKLVANCIVNGNGNAGVTGFGAAGDNYASGVYVNCEAYNCRNGVLGYLVSDCYAENSSFYAFYTRVAAVGCHARGGSGSYGFKVDAASEKGWIAECIAANKTNGFVPYSFNADYRMGIMNCIAYNCSQGFPQQGSHNKAHYRDCVAVNCATTGFGSQAVYDNCATYGNGATFQTGTYRNRFLRPPVALSANPFVDAVSADFRLNDTAGGGPILARAGIGLPGQVGGRDLSAIQTTLP